MFHEVGPCSYARHCSLFPLMIAGYSAELRDAKPAPPAGGSACRGESEGAHLTGRLIQTIAAKLQESL